MANTKKKTKKKKTSSRKPNNKSLKKKSAQKKSHRAKTSPGRNATTGRGNPGGISVDNVLKHYNKERSSQEIQLASLRKKIEELEAKTRAFREQIGKMTKQETAMKNSIALLDSRRDEEITKLLEKLGVQLRGKSSFAREPLKKHHSQPVDTQSTKEDAKLEDDDSETNDPD